MYNNINNKWSEHIQYLNGQVTNMWNFLAYNTFIDKEINNLTKINEELTSENNLLKLKRQLDCCDENISKKPKYTKMVECNMLKDEYTKIYNNITNKKYNFMVVYERDNYAKKLYENLNSIEDIILLKNSPYKFDFIYCKKFTSLYNIIPALEEFNKIIGMKNVKNKLYQSICYFLHNLNNCEEMNHCMIMGPPGVGKTTIAKIIGSIYLKLGFLHNDKFIIARRSDLIAKYLGQTAIKTQEVIDSAIGGVLFIDEVYSLGNNTKEDSFAKECIDTINLNMSRIDVPWLLIVGGYKEEIETHFLAYNKGLERRFTVKLEIDEYTPQEMFDILMKFITEEKWKIEVDAITIEDITKNIKLFKYFGGDMRKLLQLAKEHYSVRNMKTCISLEGNLKILSRNDFTKSIDFFKDKKHITNMYYLNNMYV